MDARVARRISPRRSKAARPFGGRGGVLVIGVGNRYRRDDAAGLAAAGRLREEFGGTVAVREETGEGTALLDAWEGAGTVILIDAVHSGARPGAIVRIDARKQAVPTGWFHWSSHALGAAEAIDLARALHRMPPRLIVFGIEGKTFEAGTGLSPEIERAVDEVVGRVARELDRLGSARLQGTPTRPAEG
jgi:hydrogenase maturation protease